MKNIRQMVAEWWFTMAESKISPETNPSRDAPLGNATPPQQMRPYQEIINHHCHQLGLIRALFQGGGFGNGGGTRVP